MLPDDESGLSIVERGRNNVLSALLAIDIAVNNAGK
jgi:hypothetical protein